MQSRVIYAGLALVACLLLGACGGKLSSALGLSGGGGSLRVLDSAGHELTGAARLDVVPEGYAIYALNSRATGFSLTYGSGQHVLNVARGEYFGAEDAYLAITDIPGRVDIGGYQLGSSNPVLTGGEMLVARIVLGPGGSGKTLAAAAPLPTGADCTPANFSDSVSSTDATFTWTYHSVGDYSQDGEVDISDLTPLGTNFAKDSSAADWATASLADGDGNGVVNLADLTPIGKHYLTLISGYKLEQATAQAGPFSEVATVLLSTGVKSPVLGFTYKPATTVSGNWYRVRAYSDADPTAGAATAALLVTLVAPGDPPTPEFTFLPAAPNVGDTVQFTDASTGGATGWGWSFGDGATSQQQNPLHSYASAGTYTVSLTVSNAHGSNNKKHSLSVISPPPPASPADTFVELSSATLNGAGTAFTIHSTDLPNNTNILYGPLTQGQPPVDNHLVLTYPYRGGLNDPAATHQDIKTMPGVIGITVAGLVIYGASNASTITLNGTTWTYNANAARINGEDEYGGHASPQNGGQYHYHDIDFVSKNSWVGVPGFSGVYAWADGHSKLVGWAMDGYPIYGPYGYTDPLNAASGVTRMTPSWQANNTGANRPPAVDTTASGAVSNSKYIVLPSDPGAMGMNPGMRLTLVNGVAPATEVWVVNQQNITYVGGGHPPYMGPSNGVEMDTAVTIPAGATLHFEFLPGLFIEDNAFVGGGTLDRYNGRYCVTPDFPGGTYAYFSTMDASGDGVYPYMIGPELYGSSTVGGTPGTGYVKPAG